MNRKNINQTSHAVFEVNLSKFNLLKLYFLLVKDSSEALTQAKRSKSSPSSFLKRLSTSTIEVQEPHQLE